ncbi:MAG: DUF3488 and transglutaminase-like domain-containing protein, partial [Desulfobacterales bacterium]|nr:DUF3488 and transglutaminase-like domain-containing protein [Desulfobacterales bacterium]
FRWESLWAFFFFFLSVFVTTVALVRINHPQGLFRDSVYLSSRIMARAIPLTILLFFLFPRLPGSVFGIRENTLSGRSGFSEELRPGSIARVGKDNSLAFRAVFDEPLPRELGLYWRTIVFDTFDGRSWRPGKARDFQDQVDPYAPGGILGYLIRLEPHRSRWLPALDMPIDAPEETQLTRSQTLQSQRPVSKARKYRVSSLVPPAETDWETLAGIMDGRGGEDFGGASLNEKWIKISYSGNPAAVNLAKDLARGAKSVDGVVHRFLAHFRNRDFVYSLSPPRLGRSPLDDFLLKTRSGYCEHYASAFAYMMNAVGIPARVVGGFLGGEVNPYGNYVTVLNAYAHAWTEIYHPSRGWVRVDPTLAVSPERLVENPDGRPIHGGIGEKIAFWQKIRWGLEAMNLGWEAWFSGYALGEQKALLRRLGFDTAMDSWNWNTALLLISLLVGVLGTALGLRTLLGMGKQDPVVVAYHRFCRRLDRVGIHRQPHQGALAFARSAREKRPDLGPEIDEISRLYIGLRYAHSTGNRGEIRRLGRRVRAFKPRRPPKI